MTIGLAYERAESHFKLAHPCRFFNHPGELEAAEQTQQLQASLEEHRVGMQHFSLDGPVFAIVTPFQPGTPPLFDDAAYIKYLQVCDGHMF